jgi:formylglycine-generating enzyme required for sulfatase activity/serine/threonine protein kinase
MNQNDARKILGMGEGDIDVVSSFTRRRKLITKRLNAASTNSLKAQYKGMLIQLEHAAGVLVGVHQPGAGLSAAKEAGISGSISDNTASNDEPAPGQMLSGRYEIREKIGQGSKGIVFRAFDKKRGEDIAIKVLLPGLLENNLVREHFLAEASQSRELYHPNIVNEYDLINDGDICFLTMELLGGGTLRQAMDARQKSRKPFSEKEVINLANTLAAGLTYAHLKTVHGDLKPENIWIDGKGNYKIMDFGMASLARAEQTAEIGARTNTDYMAPEQLKDSNDIDNRIDQYALGVLMYELLTRDLPVTRKSSNPVRHKRMSKDIASIIVKMVKVNPDDRYQSISDVGAALMKVETEQSQPKLSSKITAAVGTIFLGAAIVLYAHSQGHLRELWDSIRPLPDEIAQQQFNEVIQLVNEINSLVRSLDQAQKKLEAKIRDGEMGIQQLEDVQRKTKSDTKKPGTEQLLNQARFDLVHNKRLRSFTNRILFDDSRLLGPKGKVQIVLSLIDDKNHPATRELLVPVLADLKIDLQRFNTAEDYLWAHAKLGRAQLIWQRFNQAQSLQQPADLPQRKQKIASTEKLAEQGQVMEALEQMYRYIQSYQKDHAVDQKLARDRTRYQIQQAKTDKLEKQWKSYIKKQNLTIAEGQQNSLRRSQAEEQVRLALQEFKQAEVASQEREQKLMAFYAASKAIVSQTLEKQVAQNGRKANADYETAKSAGNQAMFDEDYAEAIEQYERALSHNPNDKEVSRRLEQAATRSSTEILKRYAPGIELVNIPAGSFRMGDPGNGDEKPVHDVTIREFNLMKHEVTFTQYDLYAAQTDSYWRIDEGWGRENVPVMNVSWIDANDYAKWLSEKTGYQFRLPSEAEWEYAARAGTTTKYPWGNSASHEKANYGKDNCCGGLRAGIDQWRNTSPVGSFPANQYGVHDMHGNVREWVQDCWNGSYNGAPKDGSVWLSGDCNKRVIRGGSWISSPNELGSAKREGNGTEKRNNSLGFRLLQEL